MYSRFNKIIPTTYGVVDLFAGPGGLAEGFSALVRAGHHPFKVRLSVEVEKAAHQTLLLRTFLREFSDGFPNEYYDWLNTGASEPDWAALYPEQFARAETIAKRLELGNTANTPILHERIDAIREEYGDNTLLIGGPPCQAYSLVGRARNAGNAGYDATEDKRHFLYEAYIDVLRRLKPAAFVMENVKGIMSSSVNGKVIFRRILDDLKSEGYRLVALTPRREHGADSFLERDPEPSDFVVCAEEHGIPQARHRVIVVGLRSDIGALRNSASPAMTPADQRANMWHVLSSMPRLRSGLNAKLDGPDAWRDVTTSAARALLDIVVSDDAEQQGRYQLELRRVIDRLSAPHVKLPRSSRSIRPMMKSCPTELADWLTDPRLTFLPNHDTRGHMASDLSRYLFAAAFAKAIGRSPKASEFPRILAPNHANWDSGKFADRFRVQTFDRPSATVTCHIAKDGHYYIHPDPLQCRSLTVREAARLQTFPDNYVFKGNRTEQYVQVGNAVPPLLARRIAARLFQLLRSDGDENETIAAKFATQG